VIRLAGWPGDALAALHARFPDRYPVLLESVAGGTGLGRYDLLLCRPGPRLELHADRRLAGPCARGARGFLPALDRWWREESDRRTDEPPADGPFGGGWFVYAGYEFAEEIEPTLRLPKPRHARAIAWRMGAAVVRDRTSGLAHVCAENDAPDLAEQANADLSCVAGDRPSGSTLSVGDVEEEAPEIFIKGVAAVLDAIGRGDVYQANLSRGWSARLAPDTSTTDLYRRLCIANPAPFAGIAALPGFTVMSSSPERLLRIRDGVASTRPIAGTRPRGQTFQADESLKRDLVLNEKERAEHVMLVDLERNDLGRICRGGTVQVDEYMTVESYATVHHIVSNVRGEPRPGVTPGEAVAALFPGGTITGCPKVRCMQLLGDLERTPRDAYTGSMGYLGLDGSLDLNILIRTLTVSGDRVEFRTGAGIVADSSPEAELEETRAKARGLLRALGRCT
jgi:anthranilate synthase component 1